MDISSTAFKQVSSLTGLLWSGIYLSYVSHSIVNLNLCIILRDSVVRFKCIVPRKPEFKINYYMPEA